MLARGRAGPIKGDMALMTANSTLFPKYTMRVAALAAGMMVGAMAIAEAAEITLYGDRGFRGGSRSLSGDLRNLDMMNFNDQASSIRIRGGRWLVCEHANFRGRCETIRDDVTWLGAIGMNDRISSVQLISDRDDRRGWDRDDRWRDRRGRDDITLYEHAGFQGAARGFDDDIPNLQSFGFNDAASSLRIREGRWELCEHANYRGRCRTFDADSANIVFTGLNDRVSSLRRVDRRGHWDDRDDRDDRWGDGRVGGRGGRDGITLYEHVDYGGAARNYRGDVPDLVAVGFNDVASSIAIGGGRWLLCEHVNYRGRCQAFDGDVDSLVPFGFNDRVSSIRRLR